MFKYRLLATLFVGMAISAGSVTPSLAQTQGHRGTRAQSLVIAAAISDRDRPEEDRAADKARRPAELIAFAGLTRGMKVADIMPGRGYFTRLFSNVVGAKGHVWAVVPPSLMTQHPHAADAVQAIAANPAFRNVSVLQQPLSSLNVPEQLDMVWTSQNYHDVYYGAGADAALSFDKAVFASLRVGGTFIVIDHVANADASGDLSKLHRIDPAIIKQQVVAAGFQFESESKVLANPADSHEQAVFDPAIRGHTDQVVLKFRKPVRK